MKSIQKIRPVASLCVFIMAVSMVVPAFPQPSLDQAGKEVTKPKHEQIEKRLIRPPGKPQRIREAQGEAPPDGMFFMVKSIEIVGITAFPAEDFKPLFGKYENKVVSLEQLRSLAKEIEHEYLLRGAIAACYVPEQEIKDGKVTICVVEAKMGELEIKGSWWFSDRSIKKYWTIKKGEVLRYDRISKALQLMSKNPDRTVEASLRVGGEDGTTDVILDTRARFPAHVTALINNEGAPSTGRVGKGIGFIHNNFLGLDDTLLGGYSGGKDFGGGYAYHRIPVSDFGTSLLYGYSKTRAFPKKDYEIYGIRSMQENYSSYIYQDIFLGDTYKGEFSFGLDASNKSISADTVGTINADRLRVLSSAISFVSSRNGNVTTIKPSIYQGINGLGARRKSEYSSRGAENTFTKAMFEFGFSQLLTDDFQTGLKFTGQLASEKLMPQQQIYLGGIDSVRGYPSGDYLADSGFYSQTELLIPAFFVPESARMPYGERPIKEEVAGVLFFDYGYGRKRGDIQGEQASRKMASLGFGLRAKILDQAIVRVEVGFPLTSMANGPLTESGNPRVHFSVDFQDQMPEEIERFLKARREEYVKKAAWRILRTEMNNPESPLARSIYSNMHKAASALKAGNLEEAKAYYGKVSELGSIVYMQTTAYLKDRYEFTDRLRREGEEAKLCYRNRQLDKAKQLWQNVASQAKANPLILEFTQ
ncbi:MAG TPA: ShlB/FhaC/HecB family hemolysin secretion/activation protein [Candidatus Omnitrophota bacterium]|nr:ShlB/FhaC/HecB family hemolysin secretion/activation protein [Candidatus Omnitrophota bacterium]